MRTNTLAQPLRRTGRHRRAFTFMEILFVVMILGIGFIMLAAMFPAALRQTQQNVEENEFNAVAHIGARDLENLALNTDPRWPAFVKTQQAANGGQPVVGSPSRFMDVLTGWVVNFNGPDNLQKQAPIEWDPVSGGSGINPQWGRPVPWSFHDPRYSGTGVWASYAQVQTLVPPGQTSSTDLTMQPADRLWDLVRGNMILADKKQNAWGALWARPQRIVNNQPVAAPSLQLFIFPLRSRAKAEYDPNPYVLGDSTGTKKNPACDITYKQANLDPTLIGIGYFPPPTAGAASNAPNGVLQLAEIDYAVGSSTALPYDASQASANPLAEGAYVVVSDDTQKISANMPEKYNGMIFKLGTEVADQNGTLGTSNGKFWSVAEVINIPAEEPFEIYAPGAAAPHGIEATAFQPRGPGQSVHALVFGRQIDPADPSQQSDAARSSPSGAFSAGPNRTGTAQELGYYPWSVIVQQ
jgi:type II secretory pathway pseudopilin PulG